MSEWGKTLKEYFENGKEKASKIYMVGNSTRTMEEDVNQGMKLFLLSGMSSEEAKKKAVKCSMEREALFEEAINNGYTVTDEEVRTYLEELKKSINSADNKEDVNQVMKEFDSEKEYRDFEFEVYKKDLPIQKYVKGLEEMYKSKNIKLKEQSADIDYNKDFNFFFEEYKEKLVEKQNYKLNK